jgi:hypothetical protein
MGGIDRIIPDAKFGDDGEIGKGVDEVPPRSWSSTAIPSMRSRAQGPSTQHLPSFDKDRIEFGGDPLADPWIDPARNQYCRPLIGTHWATPGLGQRPD